MVGDNIEEDLHVLLVSGGDKLLIILECAEMGINRIKIDSTVTVIAGTTAILHNRRQPQRGDAEVLKVRKMSLDATEVTTVIGTRFGAVMGAGEFGRFVVGGITVCETVWHDEVNYIVKRESLIAAENLFATGDG
jgi:hypothetical protein